MDVKHVILQQIAFQGVWILCALGGARGQSWPGVLAAALYLGVSLGLPRSRVSDRALVPLAIMIGLALDLVWVSGAGWLAYPGTPARLGASPLWILALWASFGPTLAASFRWLRGRHGLAASLGAAGGSLAFAAGARFGAVEVAADPTSWLGLALGFGVAVPLLLAASAHFEGASLRSLRGSLRGSLHGSRLGTPR